MASVCPAPGNSRFGPHKFRLLALVLAARTFAFAVEFVGKLAADRARLPLWGLRCVSHERSFQDGNRKPSRKPSANASHAIRRLPFVNAHRQSSHSRRRKEEEISLSSLSRSWSLYPSRKAAITSRVLNCRQVPQRRPPLLVFSVFSGVNSWPCLQCVFRALSADMPSPRSTFSAE